ncbi:sensor histidine kinase [Actinoplanes xinjiangensis]|uniref:histidine kinase n=1 Tax=Actinoplanes xinjiangensis TaxID=512350 RepID=A0A316EVT4_9ACTN|nr:sensor histidine kinase [Actinoplanes xinjiangensis]PWK36142.1 signal transduction histidine kinase [Actinoplanes xinjiangensis]GIF42852.1 hypothetical protein Axi01nite_71630 [Actinoplanes xinjiangensis]
MPNWTGERRPFLLRRARWGASLSTTLSLLLTPLYFLPLILMITGVAGIAIFLAGIPLIPLATFTARGVIHVERQVVKLAGAAIPTPGSSPGWRGLIDGRAWRTLGHSTALAFWSLGAGSLVATLLLLSFLLVNLPWIATMIPIDYANIGGFPISYGASAFGVPIGLLLATGTLHLAGWAVRAEAAAGRWFQGEGNTLRLRRRIATLESSRTAMIDAAAQERARIERNLHDGAQQRLLAVALAVSRARRIGDSDKEKVRRLLDTAQTEARAAVQELRDIARGAHPPVLTDRGLVAAVAATAGRHPCPVELDIDLDERPSQRIEALGYYVISEALTNAAKHAGAAPVTIRLARTTDATGDRLQVHVIDEGTGGAEITPGGGLAGLTDRVRAVDGIFCLESPLGGPTEVKAIIPWHA